MHRVFRTILGTACSERPRTEAGLDSASDAVVVRPHATPCILAEDSSATVAPVASQAPVILALRCGFMVVALSPAQRMCRGSRKQARPLDSHTRTITRISFGPPPSLGKPSWANTDGTHKLYVDKRCCVFCVDVRSVAMCDMSATAACGLRSGARPRYAPSLFTNALPRCHTPPAQANSYKSSLTASDVNENVPFPVRETLSAFWCSCAVWEGFRFPMMRCSWHAFWHVYCSEGHAEDDRMPGAGCLLLLHF